MQHPIVEKINNKMATNNGNNKNIDDDEIDLTDEMTTKTIYIQRLYLAPINLQLQTLSHP